MNIRKEFNNAFADVFQFENGTEVCEYHVMIHATSSRLSFGQQLEAILNAYNQLLEVSCKGLRRFSNVTSSAMLPIRPTM